MKPQQEAFFSELYQEHFNRIKRYIQVKIKDNENAQDIAQDTFLEALKQIDTLMAHENPGAWLTQVARNKVREYTRFCIRCLRPLLSLDTEMPESLSAIEEDGYRQIDSNYSDLAKIMKRDLTDEERYLLKKIVVDRAGYLHTAKELNVSLSTAEKRMAKIREKLTVHFPEFKKKRKK